MTILKRLRRRFFKNQDGSMATVVALSLPVIIGFGVLVIDVGHIYSVRAKLQQAADISSLTILARLRSEERLDFLDVAEASAKYRTDVVQMANKNMPAAAKDVAVRENDVLFGKWDFTRKVFNPIGVRFPVNAVRINATLSAGRNNPVRTLFGKMFISQMDMSVSSVAVMPVPPGFHMLSPDASGALQMNGNADLDVYSVQINSTAPDAFDYNARIGGIGAPYVGVVGGESGSYTTKVETGVSPIGDFLKDLPAPTYGSCDENNFVTSGLNPPDLKPGVYCGGLTITGADQVTLEPGHYIIKGGPLKIDASMRNKPIMGDGVLIYLADEQAELQSEGGDFSIRAERTGKWAGVALMTARDAHAPKTLSLLNTDFYAHGIFYAPGSKVEMTFGGFNGVCRYLCFVSDTLTLTNTYVNYGFFMETQYSPFGSGSPLPAEPPALHRSFRPYLLNEAPFGFF